MPSIALSVGGGTSHDENVVISSVSGSGPYTVTLTAAVPSNVVVGDAFYDEAATPNKYLIEGISGSDLTVRDSTGVGSAPDDSSGSSTPTCQRYYNGSTPLADLESEFGDADLYPGTFSTYDITATCYNDGDLDSNNFNTGGMNSFLLTVAADDRPDGTAGTGARIFGGGLGLQCPSGLNQAYTAEWLEINGNDTASNMLSFISSSFTNVATARYIIAHGSTSSDGLVQSATRDSLVHNCILYQCERAGSSHWGCRIDADRAEGGFLNNTVSKCINNQTGTPLNYALQQTTDSSNSRIRNNIVAGAESPNASDLSSTLDIAYAGASGTISNNLSSDDTADDQGSNNVINIDPNDLFASTSDGSENYHLLASASDAIDAGVDLATTPSGVEIDIDGRDRDAQGDTWDIGADEFVSIGAALTAEPGTLALSGQDAGLTAQRSLAAGAGSLGLTGQDAGLLSGVAMTAESGSLGLTGQATGLTAQRLLTAAAGTLTLSGQDATLTTGGAALIAEAGSLALAGQPAGLLAARVMAAGAGTLALNGQAANLVSGVAMSAEAGTLALTGQNASLLQAAVLACTSGTLTLTGQDVALNYSESVFVASLHWTSRPNLAHWTSRPNLAHWTSEDD